METYFCKADCDACHTEDDKSICMQARVISDLCEEHGISCEEGIERYAKVFRERLWELGIRDQYELSYALKNVHRKVYQIVPFPYGPSTASFFPAQVLETL